MARVLDNILKLFYYLYDMALWDWYFCIAKNHSEIPSVNSNKTFILDQSHTHTFVAYCFPLYEAVRVFVKVIQKVRKHTRACEMHGLGLTHIKKFWKSQSDLIVWHKKIIICLLNANCCSLVWAWDPFFSFWVCDLFCPSVKHKNVYFPEECAKCAENIQICGRKWKESLK